MSTIYQGDSTKVLFGTRIAIAVSRYNDSVTKRLLDGALAELVAAEIPAELITVAWTPGAFELTLVADRLAATGRYAAVICLGAIVRGETTHDRLIAQAVSQGIEAIARVHGLPILFGVLACDTLAQALARAGGSEGNKGAECARAAVEMISLLRHIHAPTHPTT
ncbi:MAG: 6,7-dimethyl-8-ribityllumazine synthase [Planctomycetota bacterium]|jgi:6,7-dimethyl-8-ribityllumazine synthase|nr:6,7-dimethyl-8-ribityllumazine synthase [Planctomycetia bacterium]RLS33043.1 MAG: 6,7-dimethyl-8-ribityllumazine synthase [Planctomycetota bacterium]RLS99248.1 MAG: 6,7-dimethyl-8-ribityllumazine synthase [Planctomycetota bacterium]TSA04235.1 MAG: 6,7-dimethyl-8-ribityllumazine synthase [Planctomycetaceae bacterium]